MDIITDCLPPECIKSVNLGIARWFMFFQWQSQSQKCQVQVLLGLAISSVTTLMLSKERGEIDVRGRATRSCETSTRPSSVVRNGSSSRTQLLPTSTRQFWSGCRGTFWPSSATRIGPQGVQTSDPWTINCGLFWRTRHAENVNNLDCLKRYLVKAAAENPPGHACSDSRVARACRGLYWGRGRPFWVALL
jgi:hypothetical protein